MTQLPAGGPIRFGLIGIDSPHAPSFTRLFGDGVTSTVRGGIITSAWAGVVSEDFPLSRDRIAARTEQMNDLGVPLRDSPEAVARECDALLVVASDARTHAGYFSRLAHFGKPIYVDTRFAMTTADARAMLELANAENCLALAGSPKRFAQEFHDSMVHSKVERIDLDGALPTQPGHPGLSWYGVHLVDLAVAAMGPGCAEVDATGERVVLRWKDGRVATLAGPPEWGPLTTGKIVGADAATSFEIVAGEDMLVGLLNAVVLACRTGAPTVPEDEIISIVAIVEAANKSLASGKSITVSTS